MLPIINIGHFAIPSYPFLLLIAFWSGMSLAARQADRIGVDGDHVYNAGLFGLIAGILGARLWFVLSHWENYASNITQAFSLSRASLSTGEGLIIAGLVVLIYLYRNDVPIGAFLDAIAPGIAAAIVIANIGALLGGERLGAPSDVPWAVDIVGTARHPVQIYEAVISLLIMAGLLYFSSYRPWSGFHFWVFVVLYGVTRLFLEIFQARPTLIGDGFSAVQILALITIVVALAVMAYNFRNNITEANSAPS